MLFFNKTKHKIKNSSVNNDSFWGSIGSRSNDDKGIVAYTTCLKILSETIGKMPLHLYEKTEEGKKIVLDSSYNSCLNRPNPYSTPFDFWSQMEFNRNNSGNAYAYIERFRNGQIRLWILDPSSVEVLIDAKGLFGRENALYYLYSNSEEGRTYKFHSEDIIHLKFFTRTDTTGIVGKPAREVIANTFDNVRKGDKLIGNLYDNGLYGKNVLYYDGTMNSKVADTLKKQLIDIAKGVNNAGDTIPLPTGFKLNPLQNNSLSDAQFLEINRFNTQQIASVFGITPTQLNDYSQSSFSTSEYQQLNFYVNTLQSILTMIEQELNYKILSEEEQLKYEFKFNINAILRGDFKTQVETLAKAINNGIMTSNEARQKLDLPKREEGDLLMCNSNYVPVDTVRDRAENTLLNGEIERQLKLQQTQQGADKDER